MEENISRFVTYIIAIFILFVFPVYTAYEKKDDISYALAVRYTQDFVDNVRKKGYITKELYDDYTKSLRATGNTYEVELEHEYVRYDGDYVDKKVGTATRNIEVFTSDHILNILENGQMYTMNLNDNFNVKIKNTNVTLATVIYNIVTVNTSNNNVRIFVDYGGKILAEKWYKAELLYSKYGGIVEENGYTIDVSIDNNKEEDSDDFVGDIDGNTMNPTNLLSNRVKIGDYVDYTPESAYQNYNTKWRVLKIDSANNKVTLINSTIINSTKYGVLYYDYSRDSNSYSYLGIDGMSRYLNACKNFGNSKLGTSRMITEADLTGAPNELVDVGFPYGINAWQEKTYSYACYKSQDYIGVCSDRYYNVMKTNGVGVGNLNCYDSRQNKRLARLFI